MTLPASGSQRRAGLVPGAAQGIALAMRGGELICEC